MACQKDAIVGHSPYSAEYLSRASVVVSLLPTSGNVASGSIVYCIVCPNRL